MDATKGARGSAGAIVMANNDENGAERKLSAQEARQGEIILRTPLRRAIFIAGLAGVLVLVLFLWLLAPVSI